MLCVAVAPGRLLSVSVGSSSMSDACRTEPAARSPNGSLNGSELTSIELTVLVGRTWPSRRVLFQPRAGADLGTCCGLAAIVCVAPSGLAFQRRGAPLAGVGSPATAGDEATLAAIGWAKASGEKPCGSAAVANPNGPQAKRAARASPGTPRRAFPTALSRLFPVACPLSPVSRQARCLPHLFPALAVVILGAVVGRFLRNRNVMGVALPHAGG